MTDEQLDLLEEIDGFNFFLMGKGQITKRDAAELLDLVKSLAETVQEEGNNELGEASEETCPY